MKDWITTTVKNFFIYIFPFIVVFTATLYAPSDSDMGWHLAYGEYFFRHGEILRENIFSSEMQNYLWANHSWGTDLFTYFTFSRFGFAGISILGALVITLIFYFFSNSLRFSFWEKALLFPLLLYLEEPLFAVSFRSQLLSLLGIAIEYYILIEFTKGKKWILFLLVPTFFLWANFHGGFILGLGLLLAWSILYLVSSSFSSYGKEKIRRDGIILGLVCISSFLATLINPFGIKIYEESFKHFGNPLQKHIIEWLPLDRFSSIWWTMIILEGVFFISVWLLSRQKKLEEYLHYIGPAILLFILAGGARRYFWSAILVSLPIVHLLFVRFKPKRTNVSVVLGSSVLFITYLSTIFVKAPSESIFTMNWDRYCYQYVKCSPKAAQFLRKEKLSGKLMTFYNWGGWLIFQYPDIKPSIDGRMTLWKDENGYSAFEYYYPIEQNIHDIDSSSYDIVFMIPTKPVHRQLMKLVEEKKWKITYQDEFASIFSRTYRNGKAE